MNTSKLTREQHDKVKLAACFQWVNILQALTGLDDKQVSVKAGKAGTPCPLCGGDDRYSFKDEERGGWACRQCGGGDGWTLLQKIHNWDYPTAAEQVGRYLGIVNGATSVDMEALRREQEAKAFQKEQTEQTKLTINTNKERKVWDEAGEVTNHPWIAHKQLSAAALAVCRQSGSKLLIPVFSPAGERISHQWVAQISPDNYLKNFHYGISTVGGLVEFGAKESLMVLVGESFADTDAALQLAESPCVAICAFSAGQIPAAVEYASQKHPFSEIVICADNDDAGREAVAKAASRVSGVAVSYPPSGKDWSDYLLSGGKKSPLANYQVIEALAGEGVNAMDSNVIEFPQPEQQPKPPAVLNGKELSDNELAALEAINKGCCHTVVGGRHVIARSKYCPITGETTAFEPLEQFKNYFHHLPEVAGGNAGAAWIKWAGKNHKLGGVTFMPDTAQCPSDVYNLWRGFRVSPIAGDCGLYLTHLEKVICGGDKEAYKYLLGWLAHMVQKPAEKPSVAVFMRSVMGAGKDTMVRAISEMLGIHATTQNGDEQITGKFQGALQEKLFVFINEARITDSKAIDRLKSLISEKEVSLELKGKDPVRIPNFARFIFASNHDHVIQADPRERRYLMLEPKPLYDVGSPEHYDYFTALHKWMDNGGSSYLLQYLLSIDLTGFNPHSAPSTALLTEQKQHSMKNSHQFIREWLDGSSPTEWPERIPAGDVTTMYQQWLEANTDKKLTATKAGKEVGGAMKELGIEKGAGGTRCFTLPELEGVKARFANLYKTTVGEMF